MAQLGFLTLLVVILAIGAGVAIIILLRKMYPDKDDAKNKEIVINGLYNYTSGFGLQLVDEKESNKDLVHITGSPRDLDYIKLKDKEFVVKKQHIFTERGLYIPLGMSQNREISLVLPSKPEDLPEILKSHPFGPYVKAYISDQKEKRNSEIIKNMADANLLKLKKQTEGLGAAEDIALMYKEIAKDNINKISQEAPRDK